MKNFYNRKKSTISAEYATPKLASEVFKWFEKKLLYTRNCHCCETVNQANWISKIGIFGIRSIYLAGSKGTWLVEGSKFQYTVKLK